MPTLLCLTCFLWDSGMANDYHLPSSAFAPTKSILKETKGTTKMLPAVQQCQCSKCYFVLSYHYHQLTSSDMKEGNWAKDLTEMSVIVNDSTKRVSVNTSGIR